MTLGPVGQRITAKLSDAFAPVAISLNDESSRHAGHAGARPDGESHFRLRIVAEAFRGKSRVEQHRMVNAALAEELKTRVHALAIEARAPGAEARFEPVTAVDRRLLALLAAAKLPLDDLTGGNTRFLGLIGEDGRLIGCGGYEIAGDAALLRSIAVDPDRRASGHGAAIAHRLLSEARQAGARQAYLLTATAQDYFARLGFRAVERGQIPKAIAATGQFAGSACSSAQAMVKSLSC